MRRSATLAALLLLAALGPLPAATAGTTVPADTTGPADAAQGPFADAVVAAPSGAPTPPNTTELLLPNGTPRTGYVVPGAVFSGALDSQYAALDTRLAAYTVDEEIENTTTEAERTAVLERGLDRVADGVDRLQDRRRHTYRGVANGSVDASTAASRAGETAARATAYRDVLTTVRDHAEESTESEAIRDRSQELGAELDLLDAAVSSRLAERLQGRDDGSGHVYVAGTDDSLVLATVHNGTYHREAYRADNRDDLAGTVDPLVGREIAGQRYAESWNASWVDSRRVEAVSGGSYRISMRHSGGTTSAFIDATTEQVYHEVKRLDLDQYPTQAAEERSQNGYVLRINRTYAGGPLRVALQDADGEPVDGEINVEGNFAGRTGDDGVLWTVSPGGRGDDLVIVTATHDGTEVPLTFQLTGER